MPHRIERPAPHGARLLPGLRLDDYSASLPDASGEEDFLGDRVSNRAFVEILDDWRHKVRRRGGGDPFAEAVGRHTPTDSIDRSALDRLLHQAEEDSEAAGLVQSAIEDFAQELAAVVRRFMRRPAWRGTRRIAVGGGFLGARVGLMATGRAGILLKAGGQPVELTPIIRPDEAALCGAAQLLPPALLRGARAMLAVDIGGSKIRAGLVALRPGGAGGPLASVLATRHWRHAGTRATREEALAEMAGMLRALATRARRLALRLAPVIGIGCPGVIRPDGTIARGAQNLPGGDWEAADFNLPAALAALLPARDGAPPMVLLHNDAVVQGLSERRRMQDVPRWGVMTIGTGLGNARFSRLRQQPARPA
jgi:hypothetical protein